jgi:hypothetical protein
MPAFQYSRFYVFDTQHTQIERKMKSFFISISIDLTFQKFEFYLENCGMHNDKILNWYLNVRTNIFRVVRSKRSVL